MMIKLIHKSTSLPGPGEMISRPAMHWPCRATQRRLRLRDASGSSCEPCTGTFRPIVLSWLMHWMLMASPRSGPNHRLLRTARPASLNSRLQRPISARERSSFGKTAVCLAAEPTSESFRSLLCRCHRIFTTFARRDGQRPCRVVRTRRGRRLWRQRCGSGRTSSCPRPRRTPRRSCWYGSRSRRRPRRRRRCSCPASRRRGFGRSARR